jgi:hypothetical protein
LLGMYAFWFLLHLLNQESRAKNQDRSLFPFPFFLLLPSHSSPLYCCLLFQFTSSNMSKNVSKSVVLSL